MNPGTPHSKELSHIEHYEIIDCIGRGGMGIVYRARDTTLNRHVAIKCLRSELCEQHSRERFKREALLLAKLNHPYIVQIYDFIETPEQLALVMELVDGRNLKLHLREHICSLSQRLLWLTQIAQGLAVAHDAGIIHRDLKAENILINSRGDAKISDLGIAKSQDFNATLTEHVAGSYSSMSPEQAMGEELDFRSDLFSFGIMAYQLLCNAHPFGDTDNKLQLMQRIISHPAISPSKHNPSLTNDISELLGQLLSKNPASRPANTHWLAAQLEKLTQSEFNSPGCADDTQTLSLPKQQVQSTTSVISNSGISSSGLGNPGLSNSGFFSREKNSTLEHPTFRENSGMQKAFSYKQTISNYIRVNSVTVILASLTLLMLLGAGLWHWQPKQPHYVAVLPPTLLSVDMQSSQQALVKGAVYDAIQQSIIQLDGYYLIPQNEIADISTTNTRDSVEALRSATAADELITTEIQCKVEACNITLSRLTAEGKEKARLRVQSTKTVDVLTDNYVSVATTVQNSIAGMYSEILSTGITKINEQDYATFLTINNEYREKGASQRLLDQLGKIKQESKKLPAIQTLYTDIALDLHNATKNQDYLLELEKYLGSNLTRGGEVAYLYNYFYFLIAKNDFENGEKTIEKIRHLNASSSSIYELQAYEMIAKRDFQSATELYKKSLESKRTANSLFLIAKSYWYSGNNANAAIYLNESLAMSPNYYKGHNLLGLISLVNGDTELAANSFKQVLMRKPDDITNLNNLGLCYLLMKQYGEAFELFDRASRLAPKDTLYLLNKADAKNLAGEAVESQMLYQKTLDLMEIDDKNNITQRNKAQALAHLHQFSEALTTLKNIEKNDPQNIETIYTAALVHTLAKNNASAILNISTALKNGMNKVWFSFSWFDILCSDIQFIDLIKEYGEHNRCTLQLTNNN